MNIKEAREVLKDELRIAQGLGQLKVPPNKREQALTFGIELMDKVDGGKMERLMSDIINQGLLNDLDTARIIKDQAQAIVKYLQGEPNG
jgi:hypothetical protein